jgi:hypothetical protein
MEEGDELYNVPNAGAGAGGAVKPVMLTNNSMYHSADQPAGAAGAADDEDGRYSGYAPPETALQTNAANQSAPILYAVPMEESDAVHNVVMPPKLRPDENNVYGMQVPGKNSKTAAPIQRCPKCKAKVQVCTCNVRRSTGDMARVQQQAKCVQATSQGPCQQLAAGKSSRCADHTCQHSKCHGAKSSQAKHCKKHAKQEGGAGGAGASGVDARLYAPAADTEA